MHKQCIICGENKPKSDFEYGNRNNRSYCAECNKIDQQIYSKEGLEAVKAWRVEMRKQWQ